jgi:hypothetical protein
MMWMWDNYTTDPKERKVYAFAGNKSIEGIAASIGATAQNDILRDEGVCP